VRLRVHAVTTRYPHHGAHSGIRQFLAYLDPAEYELRPHVSADGDDDFPLRSPRLRRLLTRLTRARGMPWYGLSDLIAELNALALCLGRRVDIIHFLDAEHAVQYLPFFRGHARARLIGTFHQPPDILAGLVRPEVVRRLDHVTVVSPEQVGFVSRLLPADRISVILHGVDTDFFRPTAVSKGAGPFECITVGHWLRDYGALRKVAETLSHCREISFRVVSPPERGLGELSNTTVCSRVSDEELRDLYRRADVLLLPLTHATANNALLEGIACGLPVISTALESVRTYVPGEEAILVERNDPDQLAEAVLRLYRDPALRLRMGHAARRRALELSWPRVAGQYGALYRRLARPCRASRG
jgi:glycosyltransferase involved in cell wall biosynthesis